jgi:hypothetical protein
LRVWPSYWTGAFWCYDCSGVGFFDMPNLNNLIKHSPEMKEVVQGWEDYCKKHFAYRKEE